MLKWIGRILFIVIVAVLALQVYGISYYSMLDAYYVEYVAEHMDDDDTYLHGITTLMGLDYYRMSPLLYDSSEHIVEDENYQLRLTIRAVGATENDVSIDGLMIFVNNVRIIEDGVEVENPIIRITVMLSDSTLRVGESKTDRGSVFYNPSQPFAYYNYYNVPLVFLFDTENYLLNPDTDEIAQIERIEVSYSNGELNETNEFSFNPQLLFVASRETYDEAVLGQNKHENFDFDASLYKLREQFSADKPSEDDIILFDLMTERGDLSEFNGIIFRNILIYVLVVSLLTYLIFFHRRVRESIQTKKYQQKAEESKKLGHLPIFRDPEEKEGK
jgi:hypothetical protein